MKKQNRKQGFTLVELLVVIAILAILATVSIVGYTAFIKKANESNALAACRSELTELQGLYALRGGSVPEGLILGSDGYYFVVKNGVLEKTEAPADARETKLQVCSLYTKEGKASVDFGSANGINTVKSWSDCITVLLNGLEGQLDISVWDDDGSLIYEDSGKVNADSKFICFDLYHIPTTHESGNAPFLTDAAPATAAQAYNRYYTYTLTIKADDGTITSTISGVFYYAAPATEAAIING